MADTHQDILQSAAAAFNAGDVASAETLCRRALAMQPRSPQAWGLLGRVRTRLSRWAEAEDALNQALRLAPSDAETTFSLGVLRMRVGRYSDAVGHFERAEELNPRHPGAKPARASCPLPWRGEEGARPDRRAKFDGAVPRRRRGGDRAE